MEVSLLSIEDIQFDSLMLLVRHRKGRCLRTIQLGVNLVSRLRNFLCGQTTGLIFRSVRGQAINEQSTRDVLCNQLLTMHG